MISVKWISNFGNNMFQFAVLYSVCKETGYQMYSGNWQGNSNDDIEVGNGKVLYNLPPDDVEIPIIDNIWHDTNDCMAQTYDTNIFKIQDNTQLYGFFQCDKYFIKYRDDILKFYKFKDESINNIATTVIQSLNRKCIICCHNREGDYWVNPGTFPIMNEEYYKKAIELIKEKQNINDEDIGVVVTTDNIYTTKFNFLNDMNICFIISKENKFVDMTIMKNSNHCITAASSFSWWGAWLNENNPIIVSPKYWINHFKNNSWAPEDIKMSLSNQYFIDCEGNIC